MVETGVAHGLTSRVILEGLDATGAVICGASISGGGSGAASRDRHSRPRAPAIALDLRGRDEQARLPGLVRTLQRVDLFVHDSLHTARNLCFELDTVWPALPPGGMAVSTTSITASGSSLRRPGGPRSLDRGQARHRKGCGGPRSRRTGRQLSAGQCPGAGPCRTSGSVGISRSKTASSVRSPA